MHRIAKGLLLAAAVVFLFTGTTYGATAYTDYDSFMADLTGTINVLDFEGMDGHIIENNDTVGGVTFSYPEILSIGGISMMVNEFEELGIIDDFTTDYYEDFMNGDGFSLSFAPSNAIGMYFITSNTINNGDFTITANGVSADLDISSTFIDLGDGYYGFFVGIIDDETPIISADITSNFDADPGFYYTVDDIVTTSAVPVPPTILLLGSSLLCLSGAGRRIKKFFK